MDKISQSKNDAYMSYVNINGDKEEDVSVDKNDDFDVMSMMRKMLGMKVMILRILMILCLVLA